MADKNDQEEKKMDQLYIKKNNLPKDALKAEKLPANFVCVNGHKLSYVRLRSDEVIGIKYKCSKQIGGCKDDDYNIRSKNPIGCNTCKYFICKHCWDLL